MGQDNYEVKSDGWQIKTHSDHCPEKKKKWSFIGSITGAHHTYYGCGYSCTNEDECPLRLGFNDTVVQKWRDGVPPKPWCDEWFIAETVYGDRVVIKSLSGENSYEYRTADDTYLMGNIIKRWMQFPDSDYVSFEEPVQNGRR